MSAIQLWRVNPVAIPVPDVDSAFIFLNDAGALSSKMPDGSVMTQTGSGAGPVGPAGATGAASTVAGPVGPAGAAGAVGPAGPGRESIYSGISAQVEVANSTADLVAINFDLLANKAAIGDTINIVMHGETDGVATAPTISAFLSIWGNRVNAVFAQSIGVVVRTPYIVEQWITFRPGNVCAVVQQLTFGAPSVVKLVNTTVVAANPTVTMNISGGVNMSAANASKMRVTAGYLTRV